MIILISIIFGNSFFFHVPCLLPYTAVMIWRPKFTIHVLHTLHYAISVFVCVIKLRIFKFIFQNTLWLYKLYNVYSAGLKPSVSSEFCVWNLLAILVHFSLKSSVCEVRYVNGCAGVYIEFGEFLWDVSERDRYNAGVKQKPACRFSYSDFLVPLTS